MPDLETQIATWRRQMLAAGIKTLSTLDELESHLRDEIDRLRTAGVPETEVMARAVSHLGHPPAVQAEFKKLGLSSRSLANIVTAVWASVLLLLAAVFSPRLLDGRWNGLLASHVFTVTAGYLAAFVVGGCGMAWICAQWMRGAAAGHPALMHTAARFTRFAAALIVVAVVLGMFWSGQNLGRYFMGDYREIGGMCGGAWFAALWIVRRSPRLKERAAMLLGVGGSMLVGFAWFGAVPLDKGAGASSYWPLAVLAGLHFLFLLGALVRPLRSVKT
jgi:hypothetical protein